MRLLIFLLLLLLSSCSTDAVIDTVRYIDEKGIELEQENSMDAILVRSLVAGYDITDATITDGSTTYTIELLHYGCDTLLAFNCDSLDLFCNVSCGVETISGLHAKVGMRSMLTVTATTLGLSPITFDASVCEE